MTALLDYNSQLLVAVDSLLHLGVDGGLRGKVSAGDHHQPLGLVVPTHEEETVGS